jgi:hypothetical protein
MSRTNLALERDARKCSRVRNLNVYMLKAFWLSFRNAVLRVSTRAV